MNLREVSVGGGWLLVGWDAPFDFGGVPLSSYHVYLNGNRVGTTSANETVYKVFGLKELTDYKISVSATNLAEFCSGEGVHAQNVTLTTGEATIPQPPLNLKALSITGASATFQWDLPIDDGGAEIVGSVSYFGIVIVVWGDQTQFVWIQNQNITSPPFTVGSAYYLDPFTEYKLSVSVANYKGVSLKSSTLVVNTGAPTVPGPPPPLIITGVTGGGAILSWLNGHDFGDVPSKLKGYKLFRNDGGETPLDVLVLDTTVSNGVGLSRFTDPGIAPGGGGLFRMGGLTPSVVYKVALLVVNELGEGPLSKR